jgi:hypothetical protein
MFVEFSKAYKLPNGVEVSNYRTVQTFRDNNDPTRPFRFTTGATLKAAVDVIDDASQSTTLHYRNNLILLQG